MATLFDHLQSVPAPDFRVPFLRVLSWNDVISFGGKWQVTRGVLDDWLDKSRTRCAEVLALNSVPLLPVEIRKEGKAKVSTKTGLPLKTPVYVTRYQRAASVVFREPLGCILRLWRPNAITYDITNMLVKPIFDGFVDCRLFPDDSVRELPQVGFDFVGVDPALAYTAAEMQERAAHHQQRKDAGKSRKNLPLRVRLHFDFYRLSRIAGGSLFQFTVKAPPPVPFIYLTTK